MEILNDVLCFIKQQFIGMASASVTAQALTVAFVATVTTGYLIIKRSRKTDGGKK